MNIHYVSASISGNVDGEGFVKSKILIYLLEGWVRTIHVEEKKKYLHFSVFSSNDSEYYIYTQSIFSSSRALPPHLTFPSPQAMEEYNGLMHSYGKCPVYFLIRDENFPHVEFIYYNMSVVTLFMKFIMTYEYLYGLRSESFHLYPTIIEAHAYGEMNRLFKWARPFL